MGGRVCRQAWATKVLLFALSRRIRSSRQIEYAVEHSIDFIWLTSGRKLDHSTLSEFRRKHEKELKDIYRQMIQLAISMGVAKLSELCSGYRDGEWFHRWQRCTDRKR